MKKVNDLQNLILKKCKDDEIVITIYLNNGVPLKGKILFFDLFTVLIETDRKQTLLVYKHSISSINNPKPIDIRSLLKSENNTEDNLIEKNKEF